MHLLLAFNVHFLRLFLCPPSDTYIRPTETLNCLSIADLKATPEGGWRGIFLVLPMTLNRSGLLSVSEKHRVT